MRGFWQQFLYQRGFFQPSEQPTQSPAVAAPVPEAVVYPAPASEAQEPKDFAEWFDAQPDLPNFSSEEVLRVLSNKRKGAQNEVPPRALWENLAGAMRVWQEVRTRTGKAVLLNSTYRSPRYNAVVGGAQHSLHLQAKAVDARVAGLSPREVFGVLMELREGGFFRGGIGQYSSFCHADIRGSNATWTG
ncbi:MAG: D-Ala-D-Ala carboxypeptidase family metallohydrolase [Verrucomicrobiota bacterium]